MVRKFSFAVSQQSVFSEWKLYKIVGAVISSDAFMNTRKGKYI